MRFRMAQCLCPARKVIREMEKAQQKSRELMDKLGFSYESQLWKDKAERN